MKTLRHAALAAVLILPAPALLAGPQLHFDLAWTHFASQSQNEPQADVFDSRSDAKGPEPEALVIGEIDG